MSEDANRDNVVELPCVTRLDIDPDRVLTEAKGRLEKVVILGYTTEGDEFFSSSVAAGDEVLWLLERSKLKLLRMADTEGCPHE